MAAQRVLEMDFATELGKTQRIRIYDAKEDLTPAQVAAAMDSIVTADIFTGTGGNFTGKISARVVTTDSSEITLV
jgi:hypothetical protein